MKSFSAISSENVFLVIAGPIDESDSYYKKLLRESTKSKNIIWAGMVEGDLKWEMLRQADALTLPSHQENFGIVVAEALSVGTPVFLTNKVNLWREVDSYGAGIVARDNQVGIDQLIRSWKDNQHGEMASAALRCFEEKLHIRNTASNIIGLLKDLNVSTN
jgi:glycosyltransferase involved in cell wall biosynthesis